MSRIVRQCQIAIAEAVEAFGRVDVLLGCTTEGTNFSSNQLLLVVGP